MINRIMYSFGMLLAVSITASYSYSISEKMCESYSKFVKKPNIMLERSGLINDCKVMPLKLIVGGDPVVYKEFPHMALMGDSSERTCGGSLISDRFILTAAHCALRPMKTALLGIILRRDTLQHGIEMDIKEMIVHPKFHVFKRINDIALAKLMSKIELNSYIRPACLNVENHLEKNMHFVATGWGKAGYVSVEGTEAMMKVQLDSVPRENCSKKLNRIINQGQLCAGYSKGGKDTCQGDSGGPLQISMDDPYCMYRIVGVVSYGSFCGFPNTPGVYTNVSHYVNWIEPIVWKV